ncbi:hypothetical protein F3Y22_tig00110482pilonHSYRG00449 [Hibiscus syriacus]|uniref:Uncharacterized protein n=1 Tax=Hibiscus syriacus TaxID=106335 RepID=A0A6A3AER5_HIBSY|nr:hypothetical protein F3Y22_tig00110482pilonHSYRG00449 [Hibiscus syriacus]
MDTSNDEMNVDESQQQNISHSSSCSTSSQSGDGIHGGGLSPVDDDDNDDDSSGCGRDEIRSSSRYGREYGLVPLVDIFVIDQNLVEIYLRNLEEIEVNLKIHQEEKVRSILQKALHLVEDQVLVTLVTAIASVTSATAINAIRPKTRPRPRFESLHGTTVQCQGQGFGERSPRLECLGHRRGQEPRLGSCWFHP